MKNINEMNAVEVAQAKVDFENPDMLMNYSWFTKEVFWQSSKVEGAWFVAKDVGEGGCTLPDWSTLHMFRTA